MKRLISLWLLLAGIVCADYPFAGGSIVRLDTSAKQITVKTGPSNTTFIVTTQTYLLNGPEKITFDKLKLGDPVKLNYYTNETGRAFIRRLKIDHPATDDIVDKAQ